MADGEGYDLKVLCRAFASMDPASSWWVEPDLSLASKLETAGFVASTGVFPLKEEG